MNSLLTIKLSREAKLGDESICTFTQIVPRVMLVFPSVLLSRIHVDAEHDCKDGDDE